MEHNYFHKDGDTLEIDSRVFGQDFDIADVIVTDKAIEEANRESVDEEESTMFDY